jgi:hypothetical protein
MASGRAADREDPGNSRRNAARILDWDPISELHQGQRSDAPHRRAGHMTAPDHIAGTARKTLACGGRSLIAPPLSIASYFLLPFVAAPGSRFSPRSEGSAATSGSKHRRCNVHNGLACIVCGPRPTCAAACTLAPSGNRHIRGDAPDGSRRDSSGGYWLLGPAEWLARAPDAVHDHGEFPSKRYARLACT